MEGKQPLLQNVQQPRRDYKEIREMQAWDMHTTSGENIPLPKVFKDKVIQVQQRFVKMRKPFCRQCLILDWNELYVIQKRRFRDKLNPTQEDVLTLEKMEKMMGDLEQYGVDSFFKIFQTGAPELQGKSNPEEITTIIKTSLETKKRVVEALYVHYMCKNRMSHVHSIETPIELWEKRNNKKWKSYSEEEVVELLEKETKTINKK